MLPSVCVAQKALDQRVDAVVGGARVGGQVGHKEVGARLEEEAQARLHLALPGVGRPTRRLEEACLDELAPLEKHLQAHLGVRERLVQVVWLVAEWFVPKKCLGLGINILRFWV